MIPFDSPTVPIADAVSNKQVPTGIFSTILITAAAIAGRVRYIMKSVAACLTILSSILLPNSCTLFFLRNTEEAFAASTARVVVFIPPAVDPGDPPISINAIMSMVPAPDRDERDAVLKPAVLGVTA